ncbi:MAG: hypothetical protein HOP20_10725 [Sulfuriferula sp.]|nr:hypothetical protein [Sulfuriferula sp.]
MNKYSLAIMTLVSLFSTAHASEPNMQMQTGWWSHQVYDLHNREIIDSRDSQCRSAPTDHDLWQQVNEEFNNYDDCYSPHVKRHGNTIIASITCTDLDADERTIKRYTPTAYDSQHRIIAYRSEGKFTRRTAKRTSVKKWISQDKWQGACPANPPN